VFRRRHNTIALLSIALLAIDAVVSVLGHSHSEHFQCDTAATACGHTSDQCSHDHAPLAAREQSDPPASGPISPGSPHDDCSLCRHFSQPVVAACLAIEVVDSQRVEMLAPALLVSLPAAIIPRPIARGPPAGCA
jgi:hypothetical protein